MIKLRLFAGFFAAWATLLSPSLFADNPPGYHVLLDITNGSEVADYAIKSHTLVMEWYPKINEILYDPSHPLPYGEIRVIFEPSAGGRTFVAFARGNEIHVSSVYIRQMPDDFRAMMVHELSHINQHYPHILPDEVWLVEGLADYIRHKYYERDKRLFLHLNQDGRLFGYTKDDIYLYGLQQNNTNMKEHGYKYSYTVSATFLMWLESRKYPQIIHALNLALSQDQYSNALFEKICGQTLDALWAEFISASIDQSK